MLKRVDVEEDGPVVGAKFWLMDASRETQIVGEIYLPGSIVTVSPGQEFSGVARLKRNMVVRKRKRPQE